MADSPAQTQWNERFSGADYLFGTAPNAFLVSQAARFSPGQRVLALADGEGRNGVWLARQGLDVLSVDFSDVALEKARLLAERHGVTLETRQVDLAQWQIEAEGYDAIVAIFIQFAPPALRERLFASMRAGLRPGGHLVLQGYRPAQLAYGTGGPPHAENMYDADLLRRAFDGLEILHLAEHDSEINEGRGHRGTSALVDLVARRPHA